MPNLPKDRSGWNPSLDQLWSLEGSLAEGRRSDPRLRAAEKPEGLPDADSWAAAGRTRIAMARTNNMRFIVDGPP